MSSLSHLSMRVPWRDRPWDQHLCDHPLDNSSCLLLKNIGEKRDDDYEVTSAGLNIDVLDAGRLPCLSERGTFMSPTGYAVTKQHPYRTNPALKGHLQPTVVSLPGYAFEAVPFRWLSRKIFESDIWHDWHTPYDPDAEKIVHRLIKRTPNWIMNGANQQAVIRQFFEPVEAGHSLVFLYLKHSPFQDESARRLLVGAAVISDVQLPGYWDQTGKPPFDSSMWETTVVHTLRPGQKNGVLLPYQSLVHLIDEAQDIEPALAWAPEGARDEFSYVTEHVSSDTAIDALQSLRDAADGLRALGIDVSSDGIAWIDRQIERLWEERGPTPGLASMLSYLGVERAHVTARTLHGITSEPWTLLEAGFADRSTWPTEVTGLFADSVGLEWQHTDPDEREVMKLLSTLDLRIDQVRMLMEGDTPLPLEASELIGNPYYASICTHGDPRQVALRAVDRAIFPADHATWSSAIPDACRMDDPRDQRRVEALIVAALHALAAEGNTIGSQSDVIAWVNEQQLSRPCQISKALLAGHQLDPATLAATDEWTPIVGATLGNDIPAYKLLQFIEFKQTIVPVVEARLKAPRFPASFNPRQEIDKSLQDSVHNDNIDAQEEAARVEKATGLEELYASRMSVLVGPAGTGKTTLVKALVDLRDVSAKQVLLLAPTGKASVQLSTKVGRPARTLASFLTTKGGYDWKRDGYSIVDPSYQEDYGLVVIDEASMLTEAMLAATMSALGQVDRLILVGDPRQLPPIGAGRPFVDLVNHLRPSSFTGSTRVGPSYVELKVFRRQDGKDRDDLLLAQWFGDGDLGPGADTVWERLRTGATSQHISHVPWFKDGVISSLDALLKDELDWSRHPDREIAFKMTYGGVLSSDGKYLNWMTGKGGAGEHCEDWQILSPARSRAFGVVEINRHLKRTLRTGDLSLSRRYGNGAWRNSKPIGPEQIVRGDKVMQTRNDPNMVSWPAGSGLDYVANGEIGVAVGSWSSKPNQPAHVEFSSQIGAKYSYWASSTDDPPLELAWAVTVHKSQGSEFGTTFLVLPKRVNASRELLYTALTRQTERVVILHDGSVDDLVALAHPSRSETARRLTDLFAPSLPRVIQIDDIKQRFDANLVHIADNGVLVRSKNEVIVADILEKLAPGRWRYEVLLKGSDGSWCRPDFAIASLAGTPIYWEHLGMMEQPVYAARWAEKLRWYSANGILPGLQLDGTPIKDASKRGGPNGILIWTDDAGGVDKPAWRAMAEDVIGPAVGVATKKTAKKAAPRVPRDPI